MYDHQGSPCSCFTPRSPSPLSVSVSPAEGEPRCSQCPQPCTTPFWGSLGQVGSSPLPPPSSPDLKEHQPPAQAPQQTKASPQTPHLQPFEEPGHGFGPPIDLAQPFTDRGSVIVCQPENPLVLHRHRLGESIPPAAGNNTSLRCPPALEVRRRGRGEPDLDRRG